MSVHVDPVQLILKIPAEVEVARVNELPVAVPPAVIWVVVETNCAQVTVPLAEMIVTAPEAQDEPPYATSTPFAFPR